MFKRAWLAGLAGVFAISAGVSAANAESYTLTVVEASCGGNPANCSSGNFPAGLVGFTGTWNSTLAGGGLNFNLPSGGTDTIAAFFATGSGNLTNFVSVNGGSPNDPLSAGNYLDATLFIFEGTVLGPNSGDIVHDDGIGLFLNGTLITPPNDQDPTSAQTTAYSIGSTDVGAHLALFYVAANSLPEVLLSPNLLGTPLPGTVWLFGAGLGGIAMLMRRRRRGMVAA